MPRASTRRWFFRAPARRTGRPDVSADPAASGPGTTLAQRLVRAPQPAIDAGHVRASEWLASIAHTVEGSELVRLSAELPFVDALIEGIAEGSPYLWDLVTADAARFLSLLSGDPDHRLGGLLT